MVGLLNVRSQNGAPAGQDKGQMVARPAFDLHIF